MIKLFIKINLVLSLFIAGLAQATLISLDVKELSDDSYIEYNHNGVIYDIAWASTVNTQKYYDFDNGTNVNILYKPGIRTDWNFANEAQLTLLKSLAVSGELLTMLTRDDNTYRHAFEYWNDYYSAPVDTGNVSAGNVASAWVWSFPAGTPTADNLLEAFEIGGVTGSFFDTFYFRVQDNSSTPVPEPSTLMIFALGIIALASKKQIFS